MSHSFYYHHRSHFDCFILFAFAVLLPSYLLELTNFLQNVTYGVHQIFDRTVAAVVVIVVRRSGRAREKQLFASSIGARTWVRGMMKDCKGT